MEDKDKMTTYIIGTVAEAAERVFEWISANKKLPNYVTIQGSQVKMPVFLDLATRMVLQVESKNSNDLQVRAVAVPNISSPASPSGRIPLANYMDAFSRLYGFITANGRAPATLATNLGKIGFNEIVYAVAFICTHYKRNQNLPNYIEITGTGQTVTKTYEHIRAESVLHGEFVNAIGYYNLCMGLGWSGYYDDKKDYDAELVSDRDNDHINNTGDELNCTDSCQEAKKIIDILNSELGDIYEVHYEHVQCTSGGHVRLIIRGGEFDNDQYPKVYIKKFGKYFVRLDMAACRQSSYAPGSVWCPNGTIIAYDPAWVLVDDGQ